ncbi:hypothetical protein OHT57_08380 [Streptomyces sp. NBC_00285]|uniref:hypothetical protein n=1 Tax=Streptomyces sp. NBC_00285 TaxID=2975700 RepID=UPI002E2BDD46|nr:hypothetical protein [Streptomyces sp. NBC_00285]
MSWWGGAPTWRSLDGTPPGLAPAAHPGDSAAADVPPRSHQLRVVVFAGEARAM